MAEKKIIIRDCTISNFLERCVIEGISPLLPEHLAADYHAAGIEYIEVWNSTIDNYFRIIGQNPPSLLEEISHSFSHHDQKLCADGKWCRNITNSDCKYPPIDFFKFSADNGIKIISIHNALNDIEILSSFLRAINSIGCIPDVGIFCEYDTEQLRYSPEQFAGKVLQLANLGAQQITIWESSGFPPLKLRALIKAIRKVTALQISLHATSPGGHKLASALVAMMEGVEIIDTIISGCGVRTPLLPLEPVFIFSARLGLFTGISVSAIDKIKETFSSLMKSTGKDAGTATAPEILFPLSTPLPPDILALFDDAIEFAAASDEESLLYACEKIAEYFSTNSSTGAGAKYVLPDDIVSYISERLRLYDRSELTELALKLVHTIRRDAGGVPLVDIVGNIISSQAVLMALDRNKGLPDYSTLSEEFIQLISGDYGQLPASVNPDLLRLVSASEYNQSRLRNPGSADSF